MNLEMEDKGDITDNNVGYYLNKRQHGDPLSIFKKNFFRKSALFGISWVWVVSDKDVIKKLGT